MGSALSTPSPASAFSGPVEPTKLPLHYQAGLAVVALAMVLLPVVYLALVVAMGQLVWWHLSHDFVIVEHVQGRATLFALLLYLGPAIAGVIFVVFLIKPLFSRRPKAGPAFRVLEADEPELFGFVRKVCDVVGAPHPREVRLDCQVNASAGFRRGWWSFWGNDLVLVIGVPLVAGMTMRQVAGVLAHEFGHFAQGAGMRLSYIIRSVNAWFARVVFERDAWDAWLDEWASHEDWRISLVFKLGQGGVWLGRRVLWCLMQAGHAISCFMSRQMEFDADSYEAKVAGSAEFARTAERLRLLNAAQAAAVHDARSAWQHHELPDDLPALVAWRESVLPADLRQKINASVDEEKTHWALTHPCDRDRVKAAAALAAPGVFQLDAPASGLFADFPAVSKAVTRHYYEHDQELPMDKATLRRTSEMMADRQAADDAEKYAERFFGETFSLTRIKPLPDAPADAWPSACSIMRDGASGYAASSKQHNELTVKAHKQAVGYDLVQAKFSLSTPQEFDLNSSIFGEVQATFARTCEERRQLEDAMACYENAAAQRLAAALAWLDARPEETAERRARRAHLLQVQRALAATVNDFQTARQACSSLNLIFANASSHADGAALERQAKAIAGRCESALHRTLQALGDLPHPYLPAATLIRTSLHNAEPGDNEYVRAFKASAVCDEALLPLLGRVMGELCGQALDAEETWQTTPAPSGTAAQENDSRPQS